MEILKEVGANVGTMGAGTGADIIGGVRLKLVNRKEKGEAKREKKMKDKHFGEQFTSNPNNNDGGTNNDVIRGAGFSKKVMGAIKAARERDKQDAPYFDKKAKQLKLNKEEDREMDLVADIFNNIIFEGRGRPRKNPTDPKWAAHDREHGEDDEADQNIHQQMKKAAGIDQVHADMGTLRSAIEKPVPKQNHEVKYGDGTTQKVSPRIAHKWLAKHESLKPEGKLQMQKFSQQSHANLMRAIGEELEEQTIPNMATNAKCKSCGEGHSQSKGKVMMHGYHEDCKSVPKQAATYLQRQGTVRSEAVNHMGEKEYSTYHSWKKAIKKKHGKDVRFEGSKDIAQAWHPTKSHAVGEWGGDVGSVYNDRVSEAFGTRQAVRDRNNNAFRDLNYHPKAKLIFSKDAEPTCPNCGHHNAMLRKLDIKKNLFKCRDCNHTVELEEDILEGRINDKMKAKGWLGADGKIKKHADKDSLHKYFKNKYKKAHGEVVKNED